jgi:hypothetical protein
MSLKKGRGLKLFVKASGAEDTAYVRINKVKTYSPGEESVATQDSTFIDQDDDYMYHTTGMIDPGEVSFTAERNPADAGQKLCDDNLGVGLDFKVQWKDGSGEEYSGTVTKRATGEPSEDDLVRSYSIKRQGAPVPFTAPVGP